MFVLIRIVTLEYQIEDTNKLYEEDKRESRLIMPEEEYFAQDRRCFIPSNKTSHLAALVISFNASEAKTCSTLKPIRLRGTPNTSTLPRAKLPS